MGLTIRADPIWACLALIPIELYMRQSARNKLRNDIEYEINIKAELEIRHLQTQLNTMQEVIVQHLTHFKPTQQAALGNKD